MSTFAAMSKKEEGMREAIAASTDQPANWASKVGGFRWQR